MAYDKTTTANRAIIIGGVVAISVLFTLHFVFDSYFIEVSEAAQRDKRASPEQLIKTREAEHKALASLDGAMASLARQGRTGATGAADITPQPSDDIAPLTGWNKMPNKAEPFIGQNPADLQGSLTNTPATADAGAAQVDAGTPTGEIPAHAAAGDAGVSTSADAGTTYTPQR